MIKHRIENIDMRKWFFKIYKNHIKTAAGMSVPKKVFDYLDEKKYVDGIPGACRLSAIGFSAVRQIFTYDELREKKNAKSKPEPKAVSSATSFF